MMSARVKKQVHALSQWQTIEINPGASVTGRTSFELQVVRSARNNTRTVRISAPCKIKNVEICYGTPVAPDYMCGTDSEGLSESGEQKGMKTAKKSKVH